MAYLILVLSLLSIRHHLAAADVTSTCQKITPLANRTFLNPGAYSSTNLTDRMCRYQCWQQFNSWNAILVMNNLCFCGEPSAGGTVTPSAACNVICSGGTGSCGNLNDPTVISTYYTVEGITNISVAPIVPPPQSFSYMTPLVSWASSNKYFVSYNTTAVAYLDSDVISNSVAFVNGTKANISLPSLSPGYHSITSTLIDSDGNAFKSSSIISVGQYYSPAEITIPLITIGLSSFAYLRVAEQKDAGLTYTYNQQTFSSNRVLSTLSYTAGSLSSVGTKSAVSTTSLYFLFGMRITEEVTLEQVRMATNETAGTAYLQIYRPSCPANYNYCYKLNTCLPAGQNCANAVRKVNCTSGLLYRLSARACYNITTGTVNTSDFTSYYLFHEVTLTSFRGNYLVATDPAAAPVRAKLLPGDVPAVFCPAGFVTTATTTVPFSIVKPTSAVSNFSSRSSLYQSGIGYPLVSATFTEAAVSLAP